MVTHRTMFRIMPADVRRSAGALFGELEKNGLLEWDIVKNAAPCLFPMAEGDDAVHIVLPRGKNGIYSVRYESGRGEVPIELHVQERSGNARALIRCARLLPQYAWRGNCPKGHYIQTRNLGSVGYTGVIAEVRRLAEMPL
ncbi:MAG: hypothetical protein AABX53_01250 [Nanoarchaeota archaeon]